MVRTLLRKWTWRQKLREEQHFPLAIVAGLLAAVSAGIWAGVTVVTEYQIGPGNIS